MAVLFLPRLAVYCTSHSQTLFRFSLFFPFSKGSQQSIQGFFCTTSWWPAPAFVVSWARTNPRTLLVVEDVPWWWYVACSCCLLRAAARCVLLLPVACCCCPLLLTVAAAASAVACSLLTCPPLPPFPPQAPGVHSNSGASCLLFWRTLARLCCGHRSA